MKNIFTIALFSFVVLAVPGTLHAQEITQASQCTYDTYSTEQAASCRQCLSNPGSTYVLNPPPGGSSFSTPVGSCVTGAQSELPPSMYPVPTAPYKACTSASQCLMNEEGDRGACVRVWKEQGGVVSAYTKANTQTVCALGSPGAYVFQANWRDASSGGGSSSGGEDRLVNLLTVDSAEELVVRVIDLMVQVGSVLLVLALVLAGFRFVSAQGNPESIKKARESLTWVVIGGMLLLGAQAISLVIKATVESL